MNLGDSLLRPRCIALIGASDDMSKTTARPLMFVSLRRTPPDAVFPEGSISPSLKGSVAS